MVKVNSCLYIIVIIIITYFLPLYERSSTRALMSTILLPWENSMCLPLRREKKD